MKYECFKSQELKVTPECVNEFEKQATAFRYYILNYVKQKSSKC